MANGTGAQSDVLPIHYVGLEDFAGELDDIVNEFAIPEHPALDGGIIVPQEPPQQCGG